MRHNPPVQEDFYSYERLGIQPRYDSPRARRLARGLSVYDDLEAAREQARQLGLGDHVATLVVAVGGPIEVEKTGRHPNHYTLWADPEVLRGRVVGIVPV